MAIRRNERNQGKQTYWKVENIRDLLRSFGLIRRALYCPPNMKSWKNLKELQCTELSICEKMTRRALGSQILVTSEYSLLLSLRRCKRTTRFKATFYAN